MIQKKIINKEILIDVLQRAVNKKVLKVGAGGSTGSIFTLDFGDRLVKK